MMLLVVFAVFQDSSITVEEPAFNATEISLPILRKSGTLGYVSVQWQATVYGKLAVGDIRPVSGEVRFLPRETLKTLKVEVLADDVPEIEEVRKPMHTKMLAATIVVSYI